MRHRVVQRAIAAGLVATLVVSPYAIGAVSPTPEWGGLSGVAGGRGSTLTTAVFDVTGIESFGILGAPGNTVIEFDLIAALGAAPGAIFDMTSIGWDVTITTFGTSVLSDASIYFDDNVAPDMQGLFLRPGIGVNTPGTQAFSSVGLLDLSDNNIENIFLPDGVLRLEFFEQFTDVLGGADAVWSGTITIGTNYPPAPGTAALLLLAGAAGARRRRSRN
jgi:uncharacterized protein (TIGR03382 family)